MATIIPCNLIEQEADRLLQIFRSCYKLTGQDMDDLVNLAYSASLCGTGEGTIPTFDQNNIFTHISAISDTSANISPVDALNNREQFEIDEKEIIIYIHRYYDESAYLSKLVNDYYFIMSGKGTYGVGGTTLGISNLFKIRGHVAVEVPPTEGTILPPRLLSLFANTVGGATINTPHTILNGLAYSVTIQDEEDTYFVVYESKVSSNEYNVYRFIGVAGDYGTGGDISNIGDFLLIETVAGIETNPPISNGQIKVREIALPPIIGTTGIGNIADAVNLSPFKGPINVKDNEILILVVDRYASTLDTQVKQLVTEKWVWNKGEYNDIGNGSTTDDYHRIETSGTITVDGTASINDPEIYYTTWKSVEDTTAAAAAINALATTDRVIKNDNLVLVRIAMDIANNVYKVWEFTGANGTYGVAGLTAVAGDFNPIPLVDSVIVEVGPALSTGAAGIFYEDNVTNIDAKDVQVAIEKLNTNITAITTGSPFKEITTADPNYDETVDAYRSGRIGLGSTILPSETLHLVSTQALAKGGIKVDYTYTGGGATRQQIGGQNIYSELGAASNSVEGFNTEYFANTTSYLDSVRSYVRGGNFTGDGDAKTLTSGLGIVSATKDRYGRVHIEPHTTNDDKDWLTSLQTLNEDSDFSEIVSRSKGLGAGFLLEAQSDIYAGNLEGDSSRLVVSPHILAFDNLTQLSGYGTGTFVQGYTHTDTLAKTGVAATVLGAPTYFLSVDANGALVEAPYAAGLEAINEGSGIGWRLLGRTAANFGNIGLDAVDMSYSTGVSAVFGATGLRSFAFGRNVQASGQDSAAFGYEAISSGDYSFAIQSSSATGLTSFAQGAGSIAGGSRAVAMGFECITSASQAVAIGESNISSAQGATALGRGNYARTIGELSAGEYGTDAVGRKFNLGIGTSDVARLDGATIFTDGTFTAPELAIALIDAEATGRVLITKEWHNAQPVNLEGYVETGTQVGDDLNVKVGQHTDSYPYLEIDKASNKVIAASPTGLTIEPLIGYGLSTYGTQYGLIEIKTASRNGAEVPTGAYSMAWGFSGNGDGQVLSAAGQSSFALGRNVRAIGYQSFATGLLTQADGDNSFVGGSSSTTAASKQDSIAFGSSVKSYGASEAVFGRFNTSWTSLGTQNSPNQLDRLFTLGNGEYQNESDALIVLFDGTITAPSLTPALITTAGNPSLITKEYGDANYIGGTGDVTKVGTPVNQEMAWWSGDGTLSRSADLTYNGTQLQVKGGVDYVGIDSNSIDINSTGVLTSIVPGAPGTIGGITVTLPSSTGTLALTSDITVDKVGTPLNNQVGVWTGDGTLEGNADLIVDGTGAVISPNSSDVILAAAGAKALVTKEYTDQHINNIKEATATLSAGELNAIGTTPISVIAAPGAGFYIKVLDSDIDYTYGTVAFDNNALEVNVTGGGTVYEAKNVLSTASSTFQSMSLGVITANNLVENASVEIGGTDSVAVGDGTATVMITYIIKAR